MASAKSKPKSKAKPRQAIPALTATRILDLINAAAAECSAVEAEFGKNPAPGLETLIKLHRTMVLSLCSEQERDEETMELVTRLMRPVMEYARIEEVRRQRELAEQKHRDQLAAEEAARAQEQRVASGEETIQPKTVEQIEHELKLF